MIRAVVVIAFVVACNSPNARPDGSVPDAAADALIDTVVESDAMLDDVLPDAAAGAPDPFVELQKMSGLCTPDEWCWEFPKPTGNRWFRVYATTADNIWIIGARGTILQWNGIRWRSHDVPALPGQEWVKWPWNIGGRSGDDMWLILGSAVEHWNGATWTIVEAGSINIANPYGNVWEAPNGDVWLTSLQGIKRSQNGGPFQMYVPGMTAISVWGTASNDVFWSGGANIYHWDGVGYSHVWAGASPHVAGFYQGVTNDVWISGPNNTLVHWDGTTAVQMDSGLGADAWLDVGAYRASNDVWWFNIHGSEFLHWDGSSLSSYDVMTSSLGELCCAGANSTRMVGDRWWLVGNAGVVYTKVGPNQLDPIIPPAYFGSAMWGTADNDMYLGEYHWDGHQLTKLPFWLGALTGSAHTGIGGANELWSVTWRNSNDLAHYENIYSANYFDGAVWTSTELARHPAGLGAVPAPGEFQLGAPHAIGPHEAIILGSYGHAFHFKNGVYTPIATGTDQGLGHSYGPDANGVVWITGRRGTLLQWRASNPLVMTPDATLPATADDLGAITGVGDKLWIANHPDVYTTLVRRRDASGWSLQDANAQIYQLTAIDDNNVVGITGRNGTATRWNGVEWVLEDNGFEMPMYYLFRPPNGKTWISNGSAFMTHP